MKSITERRHACFKMYRLIPITLKEKDEFFFSKSPNSYVISQTFLFMSFDFGDSIISEDCVLLGKYLHDVQ